MGKREFILALMRGARGKDAAKALILPDFVGAAASAWGEETLSLTAFASPTQKNVTKKSKVTSCSVSFSPSQDLHGYDSPWPAGGGVNKFGPNESPTAEAYIKSSGDVATGSTATNWIISDYIPVLAETQYTFNPNSNSGAAAYFAYYDATKTLISTIASSTTTFTTPADCAFMRFSYRDSSYDIQLELGSSVSATYSPYSNLCPISGWQGATVTVDPLYGGDINWNQLLKNGNFAAAGSWNNESGTSSTFAENVATITTTVTNNGIRQAISVYSGHKYYVRIDVFTEDNIIISAGSSAQIGVRVEGDYRTEGTGAWHRLETIMTSQSGSTTAQFYIYTRNSTGTFKAKNVNMCDLTLMFGAGNEPSTLEEFRALFPLDYYAYNAGEVTNVSAVSGLPYSKTSVTFGQTVYGGTAEIVAGTGSETMGVVKLDGTENGWGIVPSDPNAYFYYSASNIYPYDNAKLPILADSFKPMTTSPATSFPDMTVWYQYRQIHFKVGTDIAPSGISATGLAEFKAWLATHPVTIALPLATPTPYTYPHASEQLTLAKGTNNAWAEMKSS